MGLLKTIFGGLFSLIGGLFGGIAKLLGFGKKGGYYMELDDGAPAPTSASAAPVIEEAPTTQPPAETQPVTANVEKSTPAPAPAQTQVVSPTLNPDQPLVLPKSPAELEAKQAPALTNFATDFLVNPKLNRSSRRRPGPSVSPFKEMAKQMGQQSASMG